MFRINRFFQQIRTYFFGSNNLSIHFEIQYQGNTKSLDILRNTSEMLAQKLCVTYSQAADSSINNPYGNKLVLMISHHDSSPYVHMDLLNHQSGQKPIRLDLSFEQGELVYKTSNNRAHHRALVKALGLKINCDCRIIDACAGFGRDGYVIAASGAHVTLLEKNPITAAITSNSLSRAQASTQLEKKSLEIINRMHYQENNCMEFFKIKSNTENIDAIYLDPMYPIKDKSAKVKKESQFLRILSDYYSDQYDTGQNPGWQELLSAALACPVKRIVLKRPNYAPLNSTPKPSGVIKGKTTRYEIYTGLRKS